jgi:hypothetical protein
MPNARALRHAGLVLSVVLSVIPTGVAASAAPGADGPEAVHREAASAAAHAKAVPPLTRVRPDALSRALREGSLTPARYALERAASLFDLAGARARYGDVRAADPRLATLILRDLAARLPSLTGDDLRRARSLVARPTDDRPEPDPSNPKYAGREEPPACDANVCVHHVSSGQHGATSSFVNTVQNVLSNVWQTEIVEYGYRPPKSDATSTNDGGNGKLDVYLANIGPQRLYGYCTTDDPHSKPASGYRYFDMSAYCVLDNDYSFDEFGYPDPRDPLKVTAAHEFFHAVQFAYDYFEDYYLMEGTAAWMEDEVYDAVDDNIQYLRDSPLSKPARSLDKTTPFGIYGSWIWWRFLAEYVGPHASADPSIIRDVWKRADASPAGPDMYSTQATTASIAKRRIDEEPGRFRRAFAEFAVWNTVPRRFYDEGTQYPSADLARSTAISKASPTVRQRGALDHLANRYVALRRGSRVRDTARLRVEVTGPPSKTSPEANVVVIKRSGGVAVRSVSLNRDGDGAVTVAFGSSVARAIVIATNASTRFVRCYSDPSYEYSCGGHPVDENERFIFRATLIR